MTRKPVARGAVAGSLAIGTLLACMAIGAGLGALIDAVVPLLLVGFFVGVVAGFAVVYARYRDL
jgi:hypothetical protein